MNVNIIDSPVKVTITANKVLVVLDYSGTLPEPANPPPWYASLPYYDSVDEAIAAGLVLGQIFKANSPKIMGLPRGSIIEIT